MAIPTSRFPIESFGPELMTLLLKGGREQVILRGTYRKLSNFRTRIGLLRTQMILQKHKMYPVASRAGFLLLWGKRAGEFLASRNEPVPAGFLSDPSFKTKKNYNRYPIDRDVPALLVVQPRDLQFRSLLEDAGITSAEIGSTPTLTGAGTAPVNRPRDFDDFLDGGDF